MNFVSFNEYATLQNRSISYTYRCIHFDQKCLTARLRWGKMDLMPENMKNDIFPLISTIILPKVLNPVLLSAPCLWFIEICVWH